MTAAEAKVMPGEVESLVSQQLTDGILRITLNQPKRRNALSVAMLDSLIQALEAAAANKAVRVIVLAAAAPGFCGGHDLKEMQGHRKDDDGGRAFFESLFSRCSEMMQKIVRHPRVVIAEVNGTATAAGCQLVGSCDMAVASESSKFGVNGISSGLFCSTPMVALSRNIGRKRAMELLTTGGMMSAREALAAGLVNEVVDDADLENAVHRMAEAVASRSQAVLARGKQAFYEQVEMPLDQAYTHTSRVIVENMMMRDAEEGIGAFLEKRKPRWHDE
jgi:enoyl-CoA hydratase/carnithine racemase